MSARSATGCGKEMPEENIAKSITERTEKDSSKSAEKTGLQRREKRDIDLLRLETGKGSLRNTGLG